MRRLIVRIGIPLVALLGCVLMASGQSLCDFQPPESTIGSAELSFAYQHHDDGRTPEVDSSLGQLTTRAERIHDSPMLGYTLSVDTELSLDTWTATSWLGGGSASYRYYVSQELPLFVYAAVRLDAATYYVQPSCEIRSGVGVGRFRDVTPLAKTFRILRELLETGNVNRPLLSRAMIQIADEIARESEYDAFDDYVTAVAEAIGAAIGTPLDSAGVLAVQTELENEETERYCGAILQGGVGYELVDPYGDVRDVLYVMSADVGQALTPDSQLRCKMSWSGASEDFLGENTSILDVIYAAELADGNEVRAEYSITRFSAEANAAVVSQSAGVEYTLDWKPADVVLNLSLSKESGDPRWTVDLSISLAIDLL